MGVVPRTLAQQGEGDHTYYVYRCTRKVIGESHPARPSRRSRAPARAANPATIMFAHGYQKLFINGLGRTTQGFENMSIPVAIVSAAFVTVVELVGSGLVLAGALITMVAACYMVVMVGAAVFVHIPNGVFAADNGWELVGAIAALLLLLAAAGPGRWSVDHVVRTRQGSCRPSSRSRRPASAPRSPRRRRSRIVGQPSAAPTMTDVPLPAPSV